MLRAQSADLQQVFPNLTHRFNFVLNLVSSCSTTLSQKRLPKGLDCFPIPITNWLYWRFC